MVCYKCVESGRRNRWDADFKGIGLWESKMIDGKRRKVCRTCGYIDPRDSWVDGIYHGAKDLNNQNL